MGLVLLKWCPDCGIREVTSEHLVVCDPCFRRNVAKHEEEKREKLIDLLSAGDAEIAKVMRKVLDATFGGR